MALLNPIHPDLDTGADVERESPALDTLWGAAATAAFITVLGGVALMAPFDAAIYAAGQVEVAGARQAVQHREGGAVSALFVHEGDHVDKGQPLLQLNAEEVGAAECAMQAQVIELQAMKARLVAELGGRGEVGAPAEFASLSGADTDTANVCSSRVYIWHIEGSTMRHGWRGCVQMVPDAADVDKTSVEHVIIRVTINIPFLAEHIQLPDR